ncbi:hypothetical protein ACFPRL_15100 [Pseudoclavibacter helvolus]
MLGAGGVAAFILHASVRHGNGLPRPLLWFSAVVAGMRTPAAL